MLTRLLLVLTLLAMTLLASCAAGPDEAGGGADSQQADAAETPIGAFSIAHAEQAADDLIFRLEERYPTGIPVVRVAKFTDRTRTRRGVVDVGNLVETLRMRLLDRGVEIATGEVGGSVPLTIDGALNRSVEKEPGGRITTSVLTLRAIDEAGDLVAQGEAIVVDHEEPRR